MENDEIEPEEITEQDEEILPLSINNTKAKVNKFFNFFQLFHSYSSRQLSPLRNQSILKNYHPKIP
jgi:hypothetical protein